MKKSSILFVFAVSLLFGCQETITLQLPKYEDKVAVSCILSQDQRPFMYLNLSQSYYEYKDTTLADPRFIKTADVVITNTTDNIKDTLKLDSFAQPGKTTYYYIGKYNVIAGKHYVAEIKYNGKVINAETTVPMPLTIDHYTYKKVTVPPSPYVFVEFDMFLQDRPGEENAYFFSSDETNNYTSDAGQDGKMMVVHFKQPLPVGPPGSSFTLYEYLLTATRVTGNYMNDLKKQQEASKDPFTTPVVLKSNINGGIGIFGAYSHSKRITVNIH